MPSVPSSLSAMGLHRPRISERRCYALCAHSNIGVSLGINHMHIRRLLGETNAGSKRYAVEEVFTEDRDRVGFEEVIGG